MNGVQVGVFVQPGEVDLASLLNNQERFFLEPYITLELLQVLLTKRKVVVEEEEEGVTCAISLTTLLNGSFRNSRSVIF
jgi:hypothetical protein